MGEEVELRGVWGEGRVGGRGIVEPGTQRQMLSEQLHVILYPLQRRSGLLCWIGPKLSRLWQMRWMVGKVCGGMGEVRRGKQKGRVTGQQGREWVGHG